MKTVAVIASCDTKAREVGFMRECLVRAGVRPLVLDMSIGPDTPSGADLGREEIFAGVGLRWSEIRDRPKGELMGLVGSAVKACVVGLHRQGRIHGVAAAGGIQNTTVALAAMRALPIGFPTVLVTTVASGARTFGSIVGDKDVTVIPSICDLTGVNSITSRILANACACAAGMVLHAGEPVRKGSRPVVGVTLMGVTNNGAVAAIGELERLGVEAIGFHATGAGGGIMERMAGDGLLDGILDFTLHEITAEYFGGGFSHGALNRLVKPAQLGLPLVVAPGGLDFIDFPRGEFPPRMDERSYNLHNPELAHIKLLPDEAEAVGKIVAARLNQAINGVRFLVPTEGMRKNARPGGDLHRPDTDRALLGAILANAGDKVEVEEIPGNMDDPEWGARAALAMADELRKRGML